MENIEDYFSSLRTFLHKQNSIVKVEPENPFQKITERVGRVEARIFFFDNSYLDAGETVRIEHGRPVNTTYRYHYQRPDRAMFTYDDARHHSELNTFPYHKHLYRGAKRTTHAFPQVSLTWVIKDVLRLLAM